jgi:hypothetical protein
MKGVNMKKQDLVVLVVALAMLTFLMVVGTMLFLPKAHADISIPGVPQIDQDIFQTTFGVRYICGPTVFSEIVGYWGSHGYPRLLDGQLTGAIPETGQTMQTLFELAMNHYSGYNGSYTQPADMAAGLRRYFSDRGYRFEVILSARGSDTWTRIVTELNTGRPVVMIRWDLSHWVVLTGFTGNTSNYSGGTLSLLYGHVPYVRTWQASSLSRSNTQTIMVRPLDPPDDDPEEPDPSTQPWYQAVMEWCNANNYELEVRD